MNIHTYNDFYLTKYGEQNPTPESKRVPVPWFTQKRFSPRFLVTSYVHP